MQDWNTLNVDCLKSLSFMWAVSEERKRQKRLSDSQAPAAEHLAI